MPAAPESVSPLPQASADERAHSARVREHIVKTIDAHDGEISFEHFMREALYAPALGYYNAGALKFGKDGDFVTAPETSVVFSRVLARQCAEVLAGFDTPVILEFGAGSGTMAAEILAYFEQHGLALERYLIVEVSADLKDRQRTSIRQRAPRALSRVRWLDALPERPVDGVIVANEVLDAFPVERFICSAEGVLQQTVMWRDGALQLSQRPASDALMANVRAIEKDLGARFADGYCSEYAPMLPAWVSSVGRLLHDGMLLVSDYGCERSDYYNAERRGGTLSCYYRHHLHYDALHLPGLQDITAWVDFSALRAAAQESGLGAGAYTTQAQFLLHGGLQVEAADIAALPAAEALKLSSGIKTLTMPGEMGERYKFAAFMRGDASLPSGFQGREFSGRL